MAEISFLRDSLCKMRMLTLAARAHVKVAGAMLRSGNGGKGRGESGRLLIHDMMKMIGANKTGWLLGKPTLDWPVFFLASWALALDARHFTMPSRHVSTSDAEMSTEIRVLNTHTAVGMDPSRWMIRYCRFFATRHEAVDVSPGPTYAVRYHRQMRPPIVQVHREGQPAELGIWSTSCAMALGVTTSTCTEYSYRWHR